MSNINAYAIAWASAVVAVVIPQCLAWILNPPASAAWAANRIGDRAMRFVYLSSMLVAAYLLGQYHPPGIAKMTNKDVWNALGPALLVNCIYALWWITRPARHRYLRRAEYAAILEPAAVWTRSDEPGAQESGMDGD